MIPSLNLLAPETKTRIRGMRRLLLLHETALFLFMIIAFGALLMIATQMILETKLQEIVFGQTPGQAKITALNREISTLNQELETLHRAAKTYPRWSPVIETLFRNTPAEVSYTTLTLNHPGELQLTGYAHTRADLITFKELLERTNIFTTVDLPLQFLAREREIQFILNAALPIATITLLP